MKCPQFQEVLDLVDGKLSSSLGEKVKRHLQTGCGKCAESYEWATRIVRAMKANEIVQPPEYVAQRALALFQRREKGLLDWVCAKLEFDSWSVPELAGIRSEDRGPRQYSYVTENYQVVMMLQQQGKKSFSLTGQLIAKTPSATIEGCLIQVSGKDKILESKVTGKTGEFIFSSVPSKNFDLLIHADPESVRISIPK